MPDFYYVHILEGKKEFERIHEDKSQGKTVAFKRKN